MTRWALCPPSTHSGALRAPSRSSARWRTSTSACWTQHDGSALSRSASPAVRRLIAHCSSACGIINLENILRKRVMRLRFVLILGLSVLLYGGCQSAPTSPTASPAVGGVTVQNTSAWAPCVVIQSPGGTPFTIQIQAAKTLQRGGKLTWIRLNTHLDSSGLQYHLAAQQMGLRIVSIVHLDDLESVGWQTAFDTLHAIYPGDIWEIGGEISNPAINRNTVTPDYYMSR